VGRWQAIFVVILVVMLAGGAPALAPTAAAEGRTVTVAVYELKPFVMKSSDRWTGFTIELWEQIANRLGWTTKYVQVDGLTGQLDAVRTGTADVAGGAISITADRERQFDFSQPILDAGLQVMVARNHQPTAKPELQSFLDLLWSKTMLGWLAAAAAVAVVPAHILWLTERRHKDSMVSESYFPGIFQSFAWGMGAIASAAPDSPKHWVSRSVAILWGFAGIIFVALYTANLTATLTVDQIEGRINGPNDLYGKSVCTVSNTTSSDYLANLGVSVTAMPTIEDCYKALAGGFDAVVFDSPILRYFTTQEGAKVASMVGPTFHDEDYGFLFRLGSDLRKRVDGALLTLREDGSYHSLQQKWFGTDEG
jgi:polar amino acid transport system substrate-binding protein